MSRSVAATTTGVVGIADRTLRRLLHVVVSGEGESAAGGEREHEHEEHTHTSHKDPLELQFVTRFYQPSAATSAPTAMAGA